ncbi:hypothetical protein CN495_08195 [Bacillus thuringiensis]|uniref:Uncharacterized protein n=1 Tax=Bacillus thuringiensis TaxID=1428 RepID=A0ABD6SAZ7_BACTU|nr:hypothetical protein [Bacillus thuringiensis]PER55724.1 hypothetical protein CN495_08195 [Bacillus thuringiensis]
MEKTMQDETVQMIVGKLKEQGRVIVFAKSGTALKRFVYHTLTDINDMPMALWGSSSDVIPPNSLGCDISNYTTTLARFAYSDESANDTWAIAGMSKKFPSISAIHPKRKVRKALLDTWVEAGIGGMLATIVDYEDTVNDVIEQLLEDFSDIGYPATRAFLTSVTQNIIELNEEGYIQKVFSLVPTKDMGVVVLLD